MCLHSLRMVQKQQKSVDFSVYLIDSSMKRFAHLVYAKYRNQTCQMCHCVKQSDPDFPVCSLLLMFSIIMLDRKVA